MASLTHIKRFGPVIALIAGIFFFFWFDLGRFLTFDALADNRAWLAAEVSARPFLSMLIYGLAYVAMVALSVPGGLFMTVAGGFLFDLATATVLVVASATIGACLLFLAAKTALGDSLRSRAGSQLKRFETGFQENGFSYLIVLRLIPLFPFFIVNLAPAFLGMRLKTFFTATIIGIAPATFVYASIGSGLGAILDRGERPDISLITEPEVLVPLIGLAVLAMLPVAYRRFKGKEGKDAGAD